MSFDVFINWLDYYIMMGVFGKPGRIWYLPGETRGGKELKEIYRVLDVINEDGAGSVLCQWQVLILMMVKHLFWHKATINIKH